MCNVDDLYHITCCPCSDYQSPCTGAPTLHDGYLSLFQPTIITVLLTNMTKTCLIFNFQFRICYIHVCTNYSNLVTIHNKQSPNASHGANFFVNYVRHVMMKGSLSWQLRLVRNLPSQNVGKILRFLQSGSCQEREPFIISCPQEQLRNLYSIVLIWTFCQYVCNRLHRCTYFQIRKSMFKGTSNNCLP